MSESSFLQGAFRHFRSQRMRLFEETFQITARTRVLDVGGSPLIWQFTRTHPQLTIVNMPSALEQNAGPVYRLGADGCMLPFRDQSFDIVFSNSVIEHVGSKQAQSRFAAEVARVGKNFWVQTPNRYFPVEMHTMLPLVHLLPQTLQKIVVTRFTVWQFLVRPTAEQRRYYIHHYLTELQLLKASELQSLFPAARVLREKFCGMTKSLIAVRV